MFATRKKLVIFGVLILLTIIFSFSCSRKRKTRRGIEIYPQRGTIAIEFRETGTVNPRNRLEIKPQLAGRLEEILVSEGQKVKKGEILAWMSSTDRAALLDVARSKGPQEYQKWQDVYKPTPIISPIDGFIIARNKEPGQSVNVGDVILVIADELIVEAQIDETDLRYIKIGQKVKLQLDAYPGEQTTGVVEHIAYEADTVNNVVIYLVKIRPDRVLPYFRAGMTATIEVIASKKDNALLIPSEAIIEKNNKKFVLVKQKNSRPEMREINIGITNGKQTEIVSGISDNDILVSPVSSNNQNRTPSTQTSQRLRGGLPGIGSR